MNFQMKTIPNELFSGTLCFSNSKDFIVLVSNSDADIILAAGFLLCNLLMNYFFTVFPFFPSCPQMASTT